MPDEQLDVFDDHGRHLGTKPRTAVHRDGDWHRTFQCWIAGERERRRYVLFQLRGPRTASHPNLLDITAAGHLRAGETVEDGLRELEEELGVAVELADLHHLGCRSEVLAGGLDRELAETHLLRDDRALDAFRLQADEVGGLVEVELSDGLRLFGGEVDAVTARAVFLRDGHLHEGEREVRVADVVPRAQRYYRSIFAVAGRMLDGARDLAI